MSSFIMEGRPTYCLGMPIYHDEHLYFQRDNLLFTIIENEKKKIGKKIYEDK